MIDVKPRRIVMPSTPFITVKLVACGLLSAGLLSASAMGRTLQDEAGEDTAMLPNQSPAGGPGGPGGAGDANAKGDEKPEFPPFDAVSKGLDKVVSTADGSQSLYGLWASKKDGRLIA